MDDLESEAWLGLVSVLELLPVALDSQLQRDSKLTHFEFTVLSLLRFAPDNTFQMKELAAQTNATLPRLSHVVSRLERRQLVERMPCPTDKRATNVHLTDAGRREVIRAIPAHIANVRSLVLDQLTRDELVNLTRIMNKVGGGLDPTGRLVRAIREPESS
ncbi:MAG: MarR family transcriptional regulator [Microbacteriaceae bacterium]|jgi:DNA-binding MarR family transcriptional regulator|nr:MarR family transcriptional regulator [Microbacteriaceae bacterium]